MYWQKNSFDLHCGSVFWFGSVAVLIKSVTKTETTHGEYSSAGRALDCDSRCRGFDPRYSPFLSFSPCLAMSRILGLDVGSKTIGIAISDALLLCAHPLHTLARRGTKPDVVYVVELAKKWQVSNVVVGLPYTPDGQEGHRAVRVRVFGDALAQAGLHVSYTDERFSTVDAEAVLLEADLSRKKRKQVIDKMAAVVILQGWLNQHHPQQQSLD